MKFLKKINRGFLLLIVLILIVTIYLIISGVVQGKDKKEIVALCEEYINCEVSYSILPEEYRLEGTSMPAEELKTFIANMEEDIKAFYIDNEATYSTIIEKLETNIFYIALGQTSVTDYEKTVQKFSNIAFDGDKVTLTAQCITSYNGEKNVTEDYLALQKVDGEWKMTYSELVTQPETTSLYQ